MTMALALGAFAAETTSLSPPVLRHAKRSTLNFVAAALAVSQDAALARARQIVAGERTGPEATVIGQADRASVETAAFVNAMAGNWLDFDDTHLETVIHPSAPVLPCALALAEHTGASGREVLEAFALGAEIACRIGTAVSPGHYARGWHITTTCGVFGSAAAAARLLGLNARQTGHALGIAASLGAGVVENLARSAKNVSMGASARNGIMAARFARAGYEAADEAIEGTRGWARACGDAPDLQKMGGDLGQRWEFAANTFKPYPCGIVMHAIIDACLALRSRHEIDPSAIVAVRVHGNALLLARGDRPVQSARDARVSIHHAATAALLWGRAGLGEFLDPAVFDPLAVALRERIVAELDANIPDHGARVEVTTRAGDTVSELVLEPVGSPAQPMSDHALEEKLASLCQLGRSGCRPEAIASAVWALDEAPSLERFTQAIASA